MIHFPVAFALLLHVLFWGAGGAMLAMPRPWRRFWPVLVVPTGLALQSAVVWAGAHTGARGTDAYAWWSEAIPVSLLALALWRRGPRRAWGEVGRFGVVWAAMAGCLVLLALPMAIASKSLTTISLGSCDAADYAAGARVLKEFARTDRGGVLGLTEVVRVQSVDNFFDYWTRLNHFTPSALMAFNGTVLGCEPHHLGTLLTATLLAGMLPMVFWVARAVLGYSGGVSVIVTGVFGISPIMWYAVAHVAPGQLIAAQAVALLTWAGVALWRGRLTVARAVCFAGALAVGYWLILGAYNFILIACLAPAATYAGGLAWRRGAWGRLAAWLGAMLAPLGLCAVVFAERVAGLAERFTLLRAYDFGWKIPALTVEGWLGMVTGPNLDAWELGGVRWVLSAGLAGVSIWAIARAVQKRSRGVWVALAVSLPPLAGYWFLQARGWRLGTNASYDAYKLLAVFYPVLLPAFCWWVTLRRSRKLHEWLLVAGVAAVAIAFNAVACAMFVVAMSRPPLRVDANLRQLAKIEAMPDVASLNMGIPDMWSRLWANALLLRKGQYFETHTYEGRLNTPPRGEWQIEGGVFTLELTGGARRQVSTRFAVVDARDARFLRVSPGTGWHGLEIDAASGTVWEWTDREATIVFDNPHATALRVSCELDARANGAREVAMHGPGGDPAGPAARIGEERARVSLGELTIPPGRSQWTLRSDQPARPGGPDDPRPLALCVFRFAIRPSGH